MVEDDGLSVAVDVANGLMDLCKGGDAEVSVTLRGSFFSFSASISSFLKNKYESKKSSENWFMGDYFASNCKHQVKEAISLKPLSDKRFWRAILR